MADVGITLNVLQEILGHQSIETTEGYQHADHRHLAEAAQQANLFLSAAPPEGTPPAATDPDCDRLRTPLRPFQKGPEHCPTRFWSTRRAPSGALRGRRRRTGLVHFDGGRLEQIGRMDQRVTIPGYDEALVTVASHQGFSVGLVTSVPQIQKQGSRRPRCVEPCANPPIRKPLARPPLRAGSGRA
ncbi:hypothetical protein [Agromyces atrinae]|uniref:hypothetical protein n=1 Tax=Agromyces atrinae TaxID=592376 RepID=UPI0013E929A7|nr:hypothetical protein [Agromyces atrinae]